MEVSLHMHTGVNTCIYNFGFYNYTKIKIMESTRLPPKYQNHNRDRKSGGHRGQLSHSSQQIDQNDSAVGVGLARSLG